MLVAAVPAIDAAATPFAPMAVPVIGPPLFAPAVTAGDARQLYGPGAVAAGDFDGDGRTDLATTNYSSSTIGIVRQNGDGTFATSTLPIGATVLPMDLVVDDLDNDGHLDIAYASLYARTVGILTQDPTPPSLRFHASASAEMTATGHSIASGDVNGDGRPDLLVGLRSDAGVSLLLQDPAGGFPTAVALALGSGQTGVAIDDLNDDGRPDLLATDEAGTTVSIAYQDAAGTFPGPFVRIPVGAQPHRVAIGDLDGDGTPELVVSNSGSDTISIVRRQDDGSWLADRAIAVGRHPADAAIADLNLDGLPDIAVAAFSEPGITVLEQRPGGSFRPRSHRTAQGNPERVVVGDFNHDGLPDLAAPEYDQGGVSLLLGFRDTTAPTVTIGAPGDGESYGQHQRADASYGCTDEPGGSGIDSCVGEVAGGDLPSGAPLPTDDLGAQRFTVTATDRSGNRFAKTVSYTVVDVTAPTIALTAPADGAVYDQHQVVTAAYRCTDEPSGSGIETCRAAVPDGAALPTDTVGTHRFTVHARDHAGNTATATVSYTVVAPPVPLLPQPESDPQAPAPVPFASPADPAPVRPPRCERPFVSLVGIRHGGSVRRPTVRLDGVASRGPSGRRVAVLRNDRRVATGRISAAGTVQITLPAPRARRARAVARYRLRTAEARSTRVKATRSLAVVRQRTLADGAVRVSGSLSNVRTRRPLSVIGTPSCGNSLPIERRIQTDRQGRFTVTLTPRSGSAPHTIFRIHDAGRTVSLPVLVAQR